MVESFDAGTFVKMTLGNYKGTVERPQKVFGRPVSTKKGTQVQFQFKFESRSSVRNCSAAEAASLADEYLRSGYRSGHLFTTNNDLQLDIGKRNTRLRSAKPTFTEKPDAAHDRDKIRLIDPAAPYLQALGITTDRGDVKARQQDKWRQINSFAETLANLVDNSPLAGRRELRVLDMGSGKGYLTFAAYDLLANRRGLVVNMTGVDVKGEIIDLCNDVAAASEFSGLRFVKGSIADFRADGPIDILIALHACDTATDDALYQGIASGASIIMAAPCCHKEVRGQLEPPDVLAGILKHGIMLERTAETVTDGLRSLLLERSGYATKLFEFVSTEHTPKNNMLVGTRREKPAESSTVGRQIEELKEFFGVREVRLERLLQAGEAVSPRPGLPIRRQA